MTAAFGEFTKKAAKWNDTTTGKQAAKDAAPAIAALAKADNELLRVDWPAATKADVKALVTANGALIGDLRVLSGLNMSNAGTWANQASQDVGKLRAAAVTVRADLGLPTT